MNVRKAASTTFWLTVLFVGTALLLPVLRDALPYEIISALDAQFHPREYIGSAFSFIVEMAVWMMVLAGMLDAILRQKVHLQLLGSFSVVILLSVPTVLAALLPTSHLFWAAYQLIAILGTYFSFSKLIKINHPSGQGLIAFLKTVKNDGGTPRGHISDHLTVFIASFLLIAVHAAQIVAMVVYLVTYWQMIADAVMYL